MPSQAANLATFRKGGHKLFAKLSVYKGALAVEGEVTAVPPYPMKFLLYSVTSGDWEEILPGARYEIWTPDGLKKKGTGRVRYGNNITNTSLPIRENSKGSIVIEVGDILRVYKDVRLSDKLVEDNELFSPDGTPVGDFGSNPPPWANSGGPCAGSTKLLPFVMTGDTSFLTDPDSAGGDPPEHEWILPSGLSFASGDSTSANPSITGDPGEYLVTHIVTDPNNGKSVTQYIPIIIHGASYKPHRVLVESLPNDETHGGAARVRMLDSASFADVPDGALAILWKEEYIAGSLQSFGAKTPGRSHILMLGYIRREEGSKEGEDGVETLTFEIISSLARLDELMGYGKVMLNNATPDAWNELKLLTMKRGTVQLGQFYSNMNECGNDLIFTNTFVDRNFDGLFLQQNTPLGQMREIVKGVQCRLVQDRRGRFEVHMRPELTALDVRATLPVTLLIQPRDILRWRYTREHWRSLNRLEVRGFAAGYGVQQPIFSEWVGRGAGEGNQTSIEERVIAIGQEHLNEITGRLGAALEGIYVDEDGAQQMALDLELVLRGVYDLFDLYDEVIEIQLVTDKRGLDLSQQQFVLVSSSVSFEGGTAETTITLRTCTNGAEGSTFVPASGSGGEPDYTDPTDEYPYTDYYPESGGIPFRAGTGRFLKIDSNGYLYYTFDGDTPFAAGGPTFGRINLGLADDVLDWISDPFSPRYLPPYPLNGDTVLRVVTETKIYKVVFHPNTLTVTVTDQKTLPSASGGLRTIEMERGLPGFVVVVTAYVSTAIKICVTTDGENWGSEITVHANAAPYWAPGIFVSGRVPNKIVVATTSAGNASNTGQVSINAGGSFSHLTSPNLDNSAQGAFALHFPWDRNESESLAYYGWTDVPLVGSGSRKLYRAQGAGSAVDISPVISGESFGAQVHRSVDTCPIARTRLVGILRNGTTNAGAASDLLRVFFSKNEGASWGYIEAADGSPASCYTVARAAGDNPNVFFLTGGLGKYFAKCDFDGGFDDRSGNLVNFTSPSVGAFRNVVGF